MAKYVKTEQGYIETADFLDGKMDMNNPTGTGSFSLNRKPGTVVGENSHAEGDNTTASASYSHAEGQNTTASGPFAHAEGNGTIASEHGSHAEGSSTTASGNYSHAEGSGTTASGLRSHVEGFFSKALGGCSHAEGQRTTASGYASHAEGYETEASGDYSHADGFWTKAFSSEQHVQGKYNIEDSSNVYADIIGNGTKSKPSNAATVDWSGNAWYAGDIYVGSTSGTNKDEGSKKLATEEYVDNSVIVPAPSSADNGTYLGCENGAAKWMPVEASGGGDISLGLTAASVGQTIKVKAVDENGKPTEWEAAKEKTLKWITVHSSTLTEEVTSFSVNADENGKSITDYNPLGIAVALYIPADSTQADNNGPLWVYPQSKMGDNAIRVLSTINGWKTISRDGIWMWQGGDILGFTGNNNGAAPAYKVSDYVMDGVYVSVHGDGNHLPVGTKAVVTILCEM